MAVCPICVGQKGHRAKHDDRAAHSEEDHAIDHDFEDQLLSKTFAFKVSLGDVTAYETSRISQALSCGSPNASRWFPPDSQ
jgi:hypothetical protein